MTTATLSRSSSPSEILRGRQAPTRLIMPEYADTEWKDCHELNAAGGIEMLEWQDGIMRCWLATNRLGRWAAATCGGSLSRQNGKSLGLVVPRANYGMVMLGEEVLYTSHLQKTSTETFESIAAFFDRKPLKKYVKDIKTALGREQVILKNGGRIKFLARTRNGGRGQHGDLLIFDEALELDSDSQSSFLPAISASRNPQVIYVSSPPTEQSVGTVFRNIRERAIEGSSGRISWFEWSVDEIGDVTDKSRWYATNPSLGILIQESTVESECEQMDADTFARERLGWWSPVRSREDDLVFSASDWDACATDDEPAGDVCYGVKLSPDGSEAALSACWRGDVPHFELVDYRDSRNGLGWLADWLDARAHRCAMLAVDGRNADALTSRLENYKPRQLHVMRTSDAIASSALMVEGIRSGTVTHYGQAELDEQAKAATRRKVGRDAWCIGGERSTAIESAACALWAAKNAKHKPGRKARIG